MSCNRTRDSPRQNSVLVQSQVLPTLKGRGFSRTELRGRPSVCLAGPVHPRLLIQTAQTPQALAVQGRSRGTTHPANCQDPRSGLGSEAKARRLLEGGDPRPLLGQEGCWVHGLSLHGLTSAWKVLVSFPSNNLPLPRAMPEVVRAGAPSAAWPRSLHGSHRCGKGLLPWKP